MLGETPPNVIYPDKKILLWLSSGYLAPLICFVHTLHGAQYLRVIGSIPRFIGEQTANYYL